MAVQLNNDDLTTFLSVWDQAVLDQYEPINESTLEVLFLWQLRKSHSLKEELLHFDRLKVDDPEKSYAGLRASVTRLLEYS